MSGSMDSIETIFNGNDFCQWLVSNGHMENDSKAQNFCQELVHDKKIVCIDQKDNIDPTDHWYAFTK